MEFCSGGDLFSYIEKRGFRMPEARAASIVHKLATAVYYIHSYGIAHRDLKPENILMTDNTEDADIRLLDFGLSKIIGPTETCNEPFGTLVYNSNNLVLCRTWDSSRKAIHKGCWYLEYRDYYIFVACRLLTIRWREERKRNCEVREK